MRQAVARQAPILGDAFKDHNKAIDTERKALIEEVNGLKTVVGEKDARIEDLEKKLVEHLANDAPQTLTTTADASTTTRDHGLIKKWRAIYVPDERCWKCPVRFSEVIRSCNAGFDDGDYGDKSEGEAEWENIVKKYGDDGDEDDEEEDGEDVPGYDGESGAEDDG